MKKDAPIKKLYDEIIRLLPTSAVTIAFIVFILSAITVKAVSLICYDYWDPEFWKNIRVEAHGMLFDILVIGVIILFLNKLSEKRIENQRYLDEIDDFRGWKSKEAAHRIAGNLKRLKRNRYIGKIDLVDCHLGSLNLQKDGLLKYISPYLNGIRLVEGNLWQADLQEANLCQAKLLRANLQGAKLRGANLQRANLLGAHLQFADLLGARLEGADLRVAHLQCTILLIANLRYTNLLNAELQDADLQEADLRGAMLQGADLRGVKNLTLQQLSEVKSLYKAELDPELLKLVEEKYPHLLERPEE